MKAALALVGLALLSGLIWQAYQRGAWQERANDLEAQVAITDSLLAGYAVDSAARARKADSLAAEVDSLRADSVTLAANLDRASDSARLVTGRLALLRAAVEPDSLPEPVRLLVAGERAATEAAQGETRACQALLTTVGGQRSICEEQRAADSLRIGTLEGLRARLTAERDSAQALNRPPPLFALTFELGLGPGCVLALDGRVGCGASLHATVLKFRLKP